jgi:hypothetical protein
LAKSWAIATHIDTMSAVREPRYGTKLMIPAQEADQETVIETIRVSVTA